MRAVPPDTLVQIDRKGNPNEVSDEFKNDIEGLILLDGNWSQAKALWWRNPWLLKHPRLVFKPAKPSRYGNLRRTARKEALSTLEATASLLGFLGQLEVERELIQAFDQMLAGAK